MILKNGWFSYLKIVKICGHVSLDECEQESPIQIETQNTKNQNTTDHSITTSMLTLEDRKKSWVYKENHDCKKKKK